MYVRSYVLFGYFRLNFYLLKECKSLYDEAFGEEIKQLLNKEQGLSLNNKANDEYLECIKNHLKNKKCPSFCSDLWLGHIKLIFDA